MSDHDSASAAVVVLLRVVIWALLLRSALALWADCGKPCGFYAPPTPQPIERPRWVR